MTSTMQEAISHAYQAGIEIGRAAAKQEMEQIAKITAAYAEHAANAPVSVFKNRGVTKVIPGHMATKAPPIARGVKRAAGARTRGVKEGILAFLLSRPNDAVSPATIIAETGFKSTSVRATLMSLKKDHRVSNGGDGTWWALTQGGPTGNSESEHAGDQA